MRVVVLGHGGMLGSTVASVVRDAGHEVLTTSIRYDGSGDLIDAVAAMRPHAVVNCIGLLRGGHTDMGRVNGLLPMHVAGSLPGECLFVHASSDAVFSGVHGPRRSDEYLDAVDSYGLSKIAGESCLPVHERSVIIRASIIGTESREKPRGLLGWFLLSAGPVTGYTDHLWNGITTLAWAGLCLEALDGRLQLGIHQPGTAAVTKCELLNIIATVWGLPTVVTPAASRAPVDRRLVPTINMGTIENQLRQMRGVV